MRSSEKASGSSRPGVDAQFESSVEPDELRATTAAWHSAPLPAAKVCLHNKDEVVSALAWARNTRTPLHPMSSPGGPRRRGFRGDGSVLVADLSGMNRIIHVDAMDAVALIEPGVTFAQLDSALAPHGLRTFKPLLPRTGKSVLASALEREPTLSPNAHWDVVDPLGAAEIVFGSGETFRSGSAAVPGTIDERLKAGLRHIEEIGA